MNGSYRYRPLRLRRRPRKNRQKRLFWWTVFLFSFGYGIYSLPTIFAGEGTSKEKGQVLSNTQVNLSNPQPSSMAQTSAPTATPIPVLSSNDIKGVVDQALKDSKAKYGIYIKNLKTGESFAQDENRKFEAGSLYKLWTMATVYKQIENGTLKEDERLTRTIPALNQRFGIDAETAEQTTGTISLTTSQAVKQMITISHNYAALLLTEKVGLSKVASFLKEAELNDSKVGTNGDLPTTTPADMVKYLEKLYTNKLGTPENTQKMIAFMKDQRLNHKLPKYLPKGTVMAHKTGELGWFSHDAGILYQNNEPTYIIVVMSESSSPKGAEERIALISKGVFEYFSKK